MSGNTTTDRLATRGERESEIISLIQQSSGPEHVEVVEPIQTSEADEPATSPSDDSPHMADAFETVMAQPAGNRTPDQVAQVETAVPGVSQPEADPYLTITMENVHAVDQPRAAGAGAAVAREAMDDEGDRQIDTSRMELVGDGTMSEVRDSDLAVDTGVVRADMDAIAERQERREAIEEAHANGDAFYDGTTTVDGVEVQIWLMPDGSTVYFDPETETVVDLKWESKDAKDDARDAAHDAGDPFFEGTTEVDGELVEVWEMPDGSIAYVAVDDREVVGFEWPEGEEPEYQGQVSVDGESCSLIELPNGDMVIVDGDGDFVGYLDDVELDTFYAPVPPHGNIEEVYSVPKGPPSYDSLVYDADSDEVVSGSNSASTDPAGLTHYTPTGEDYVLVIDGDGNIVTAYELPPDEEWSVLGIVTYYEDGSVTVDLGAGEITVDLGAEGGIWFSSDGLGELIEGADWVGSVEAGVAWDEEGIDVDVNAEVAGVGEFGYGLSIGEDGFDVYVDAALDLEVGGQGVAFDIHGEAGLTSDGTLYAGADVEMDMTVPAGFDIDLDVEGYVEVGPDGFEGTYGWDGKVGMLGAYVSGGEQYSIDVDSDGVTATYEYYRGAGVQGLGEVRAGAEAQVHTDGTIGGSSVTGGIYGSTNDKDGDETGMTGVYSTLDQDGISNPEVRNEHLDTGVTKEDYDRHGDPELPEDDVDGSTGVEWREDGTAGIGEAPADESDDDGSGDDADDDADDAAVGMRPGLDGVRKDSGEARIGDDERGPTIEGVRRDSGDDAQTASMPAPPPPAEEDDDGDTGGGGGTVSGRPKIWQRRDGEATDPADEPAPDPEPDPNGPRRPLLGVDPDDEPAPEPPADGPTNKPPIFTERLMDIDEDGDGRPDGLGRDPILGDGDLGDIADGPPILRGQAQTASNPAPPPPAEEDDDTDTGGGGPGSGRPKIWQRRDGDATDPADEPAPDPEPDPDPNGPRPPLFGVDPDDEPAPEPPADGPTNKPPIFTERLMDIDEDGDGRPDGLGRDPILGDGDGGLGDIADGPPVLRGQAQTASNPAPPPPSDPVSDVDPVTTIAEPDQSPGGIERPDDEPVTADAGVDQAPGGIDRPDIAPDSVVASGENAPARDGLLDDDITAVRAASPAAPEPQAAATVQPVEPTPTPEPVLEQPAEPIVQPEEPAIEPVVVEEPIIEPVVEIEPEPIVPVEPEADLEPEPDLMDEQA